MSLFFLKCGAIFKENTFSGMAAFLKGLMVKVLLSRSVTLIYMVYIISITCVFLRTCSLNSHTVGVWLSLNVCYEFTEYGCMLYCPYVYVCSPSLALCTNTHPSIIFFCYTPLQQVYWLTCVTSREDLWITHTTLWVCIKKLLMSLYASEPL